MMSPYVGYMLYFHISLQTDSKKNIQMYIILFFTYVIIKASPSVHERWTIYQFYSSK